MDLLCRTVFFRPKTMSKVAIIKTKSATIAFFSSLPFHFLALSFSPFLFLLMISLFCVLQNLEIGKCQSFYIG